MMTSSKDQAASFTTKRLSLIQTLQPQSHANSNLPTIHLSLRRSQAFLDSFRALFYKPAQEMQQSHLAIRFHGEDGQSTISEWIAVVSREMLDPNYVLFTSGNDARVHPNAHSDINPEHLAFFKFVGRIVGLAIREGQTLPCRFSPTVHRRMLGLADEPSMATRLDELKGLDAEHHAFVTTILESEVDKPAFFTTTVEKFGVEEVVELVEVGRSVPVTEANKEEYVRLIAKWIAEESVREQLENFVAGFHDMIPVQLLKDFSQEELERLISGPMT